MNVLLVYRWLGSEEDTPIRARLPEIHADMQPGACYGQLRDSITLFTLGSVYRASTLRDNEKEWARILRYYYVIVDEK